MNNPATHARTISRRTFASGVALTVAAGALSLKASGAGAQDIQTRVQVLHAGTDVGKIEVHINGNEVLDEFEYGDLSDWIDLDPGTVRFTITVDRAGFNYVIFDAGYPVPAGRDYYVVISDALILAGSFETAAVPGDGSFVQVTQASVDTPPVTVVATGADVELATQLNYAATSDGGVVPAGTYSIEVTLSDSGESVLVQDGVVIEAGKSYQLVLIGSPGSEDKPLEIVLLSTELAAATAEASPVS